MTPISFPAMHKLRDSIPEERNPQLKRLLIVDDEPSLLALYDTFFQQRGYRVTLASSLAAAETELAFQQFDLVLLDVRLGDGNGIDFLPRIKALRPGIPVIILTGLGYDETVFQGAIAKGASGYVSKLLPLDQVLMEIFRVLKRPDTKKNPLPVRA